MTTPQERAERIADGCSELTGSARRRYLIREVALALQEAEEDGARREREAIADWHKSEAERLTERREPDKKEWARNGYDVIVVNSIRQHRLSAERIRARSEPARPDAGKE